MNATIVAAVELAASPWLAGLGAIALPVLAHLWSRATGPAAWFSSLRLLRESQTELARRSVLRDAALLVCRCGVVAMVVLAFAQPVWTAPPIEPRADEQPAGRRVAILLDASASMTRGDGGVTLFHRARQQVRRLIASLDPVRDRAAVILVGFEAQPLLPEPTANFFALLDRLEAAQPDTALADLSAAIRTTPGNSELHVFSDMQAASLRGKIDRPVTWHRLGEELDASNLALLAPVLDPAQPVAGMPCRVMVTVANHSDETARPAVELTGDVTDSAPLEIPPGQTATATMIVQFDAPGPAGLSLALPPDNFAPDNKIELTVNVRPSIDVLLLTRQSVDDPDNAAYYLARAIQPAPGGPYRLRVANADETQQKKRPDILVQCGSAYTRVINNRIWQLPTEGAYGRLVFPAAERNTSGQPVSLNAGFLDEDFFSPFQGESRKTLLDLRFRHAAKSATPTTAKAPLAQWSNGEPALCSHSPQSLTWLGSINPYDNDFVRSPAFLPLVHRMLEWVTPDGTGPTVVTAGKTAHVPLPTEQPLGQLVVRAPDGQSLPFYVQSLQNKRHLLCEVTGQAGLHRIVDRQGKPHGSFTVTLDERESDLRPIVDLPQDATGAAPANDAVEQTAKNNADDKPTPLWPWCLAGALALGIVEMVIVGFTQRRNAPNTMSNFTSETTDPHPGETA